MLAAGVIEEVMQDLRLGKAISDRLFDRLYPERIREVSSCYWTPVAVAQTAARWLASEGTSKVLDVGAGVGKVCILGATTTSAEFHGIEQRPHLVTIANHAIRSCGTRRAVMHEGIIQSVDWSAYQGFYFFNPFGENSYSRHDWLDDSVELNEPRFFQDTRYVVQQLVKAAPGTRVVTYHGLGVPLPDDYSLIHEEPHGGEYLRCWRKRESSVAKTPLVSGHTR